ncbi:hypothetical protein IKG45_02215 [Candidatus Saccharibacteria bacterium]|nr:hypothetical protein [Candidatus Saccharibacteria bacterium]
MKKSTILACASVCAFAGFGALFTAGNANAASVAYLSLESGEFECRFSEYTTIAELCDTKYGTYDPTTKTLTLNSEINSLNNSKIELGGSDTYTIKANGDIESFFEINSLHQPNLIFDFGKYSFTDKGYVYTSQTRYTDFVYSGLTIKSGVYNIRALRPNSLTLDGGTINYTDFETFDVRGDFVINGGAINFQKAIGTVLRAKSFTMNDGSITATNITNKDDGFGNGIYVFDSSKRSTFTMNGGTITLKNTVKGGSGIEVYSGDFVINGGTINLENFEWGIDLYKGKASFNGGVTTIKNSKSHAVKVSSAEHPKTDIAFGEGMGIKESDAFVGYEVDGENGKSQNYTGIAGKSIVTIAKGYKYVRQEGWAYADGKEADGGDTEETTIKLSYKNLKPNSVDLSALVSTDEETTCDIYRSTSEKGEFKKINTKSLRCDKKKSDTFTDKNLEANKTYYYYALPSGEGLKYEGKYLKITTPTPTSPDTGENFDEKSTAILIALITLPTVLISGYVAKYIKNRRDHRVKF